MIDVNVINNVINKRKLVLGSLLLFILITGLSAYNSHGMTTTSAQTNTTQNSIEISINYAGYLDLDQDNYQDDILVVTTFHLASSLYYHYYYRITLVLPSGNWFSYVVEVYAFVDDVVIYNLFYNHATESGNYTVIVEAYLVYPEIIYTVTGAIFDPPGGSNGGDPSFGVA